MVDEDRYTEEEVAEFDKAVKSINYNDDDDGTVKPPQKDPPKDLTFG